MPGLGKTDDRTLAGAFQAIDRGDRQRLVFFGALIFTALGVALSFGEDRRDVLPWALTAFVLFLPVVLFTLRVNVPLNDAIKAAGDPDRIGDGSSWTS
jgi:uncharacterized membrane protein